MRPQAFHLPANGEPDGRRFCLLYETTSAAARGSVLYVHPFAEEMNKSRRMAALQSRAFAGAGYDVLQIDLFGCGDSGGDFGEATWDAWVEDVAAAARWLGSRERGALWLWGLRAGCLLAAQAARRLDRASHFLFWQPPATGRLLLQQFLRLALAGQWLDGKARGAAAGLRARVQAGAAVQVGGYTLHPALAQGLEHSTLEPPARVGRVEWIEVSTRADEPAFASAALDAQAKWRANGARLCAQLARGPAFWQTTEIEEAPALIEASVAALAEGPPQ
jgi:exosortase A-associated hydrolase 2